MTTRLIWKKSSFSGGGEGNDCVELSASPGAVHLRESDTPAVTLTTSPGALAYLLEGIRTGRDRRRSTTS
ncbi:DUF397 domain-containing protein [Streptomyces sp. NPDC088766]|uniref:DUF397 domain-containing protein n=1 Tax=Streptomyces sp. NPDC088766 TaxID=3365893 RepID=UPI00382A6B06